MIKNPAAVTQDGFLLFTGKPDLQNPAQQSQLQQVFKELKKTAAMNNKNAAPQTGENVSSEIMSGEAESCA